MAFGTIIRQGLRIAGRIDSKYNINKIFVSKYFPPGYRKSANRIIDIAGSLGGGYGIYNLLSGDDPEQDNAIPEESQTYQQYQTRFRRTGWRSSKQQAGRYGMRYKGRCYPRGYRKRPRRF